MCQLKTRSYAYAGVEFILYLRLLYDSSFGLGPSQCHNYIVFALILVLFFLSKHCSFDLVLKAYPGITIILFLHLLLF